MEQKYVLKLVNKAKTDLASGRLKMEDLRNPKTAEHRKMKQALESYYQRTLQFIASDDTGSLMNAFTNAITKGQTAAGFINTIQNTKWALARNESQRKYDLAANTPKMQKDLDTKRNNIITAIQDQALTDTGKQIDEATARSIAEDLLRNNWDDWQSVLPSKLRPKLAKMDVFSFSGGILNTDTEIRKYARAMGISVGEEQVRSYLEGILSNKMTLDAVRAEIRKKALPYYPQFADRINAGETVEEIASPYRDLIANMLEVDVNSIGYELGGAKSDPLLLKAMSGENGKPMGLYDLRKAIKADSRWQYTSNAKQEYSSLTKELMRMFGAGV